MGLVGQHQESGLEGVLGEMPVLQDPAADSQDQGTMPSQQRGEGGLVLLPRELKQLMIGQRFAALRGHQGMDVPQGQAYSPVGHAGTLVKAAWALRPSIAREAEGGRTIFRKSERSGRLQVRSSWAQAIDT